MAIQSKQLISGRLKQVGTGVGMIQPKQIAAITPTFTLADSTQTTGSYVIFDRLDFTATTDDSDGHTTSSVDLYETGVFVQTLEEQGTAGGLTRTWTGFLNIPSSGSKSYTVRRNFSTGGYSESAATVITVLDSLAPDQITSATLKAWFRCPESLQWHTTLNGTRTITVSAVSGLNGRTENLIVVIQTTGNPGIGTFKTTIDGQTYLEGSNQTIPTGAGTYLVPTTDITITFQQAVSYTAGDSYRTTLAKWLDKVGAYPNSTNNMINDGTSPNGTSRPRPCAAGETTGALDIGGQNVIGAACMRIDNGLGNQGFMWDAAGTLSTLVSGTDKPFGVYSLLFAHAEQIPGTGGGRANFYCFVNLTDTDQPRVSMDCATASTGQPGLFHCHRVSDTGVNKVNNSGAGLLPEVYLMEDTFDGTNRVITANSADVIGGDSGRPANQSGQTITTTRYVIGVRQGQAGKNDGGTFDIAEQAIYDGPLSTLEAWRLRAYFLQ